jgi:hypothetical protein
MVRAECLAPARNIVTLRVLASRPPGFTIGNALPLCLQRRFGYSLRRHVVYVGYQYWSILRYAVAFPDDYRNRMRAAHSLQAQQYRACKDARH